jgi:hypothetical protein
MVETDDVTGLPRVAVGEVGFGPDLPIGIPIELVLLVSRSWRGT